MKKVYSDEVKAFLYAHAQEGSIRDMTECVNKRFGTAFTCGQIRAYFSNHGLRTAPRKGRKCPERRITTPEIDTFIFQNHKGVGPIEMAERVNKHFGTAYTREQMKAFYGRNHLDSGLDGRFRKGNVSPTKGKTWDDFLSPEAQANARKGTFKPGHIPHNGGAPVGTLRLRQPRRNRPGDKPYYWQKVAEPHFWRPKHIIEWEAHKGPVPDGYIVTFANGNTIDWSIDNLILVTRAQHAVKNRFGLHSYDKESAATANRIADIKIAVGRAKKRRAGVKQNGQATE